MRWPSTATTYCTRCDVAGLVGLAESWVLKPSDARPTGTADPAWPPRQRDDYYAAGGGPAGAVDEGEENKNGETEGERTTGKRSRVSHGAAGGNGDAPPK